MDLFDLFAKISIDISGFESGINQAQKKFKDFSSNIKSISDGISNAYDGLGNALKPVVDGYKAVESVGQKAGNVVMDGLKGFAAASTVLGGFGVSAVKSGMEFDATMSQVSAISGATGQDFQDLRDKALEMGAKTKFSASEAAEAMTYMGMAGWKAGDMISGIEGIMNLAAASGEDLATTSDIVTDALTAFGLQAGDSGHFADVLAVASSNANTNVGLMGETFKYVAPVAGALGYSVDDTALAIGLMANSGIKATQAGTALRSIFTRLSTDAGASSQSLGALGVLTEKLGVEFYNLADGSARDLKDIINESRVAWAGLSEEEQISYAKTIAGQEAMSGWLALMNAAPEDVEKLTAALEDCNGAAQEMAATMVDNLQGDLTLLGSAFESLQIAISDSLTPTLREFAQFGSRAMANLLEGFQSGGTAGLMDALTSVVTEAVNMLMEHAPAFAEVSVQFISALGEGLIASAPNILTAAGEVITTLISGFSSFLNDHSAEMVEIGLNVIDLIASGFGDAIDVVTAHIGEFIPLLSAGFFAYHEALFTVGMEILGAIGRGIVENKEGIAETASKTIANIVTSLKENAPDIIEGAIALIEALVKGLLDNIGLISDAAIEVIPTFVAGVLDMLPEILDAAAKIIVALGEGIIAALPELVSRVPEIITAIVETIVENLPKIIEIGLQITLGLAEGLIKAIPDLLLAIPKVVMALIDGFKELLGIHSPSTVFAEIGANIILGLLNGITENFGSVVEFLSNGAKDIVGFFVDLPSEFLGIGGNIVQGIWDGISGAWGSFIGWLNGKVGGIVDGVKAMLGIHSPSTVFAGIGENMALGLAEGWDGQYGSIKRSIEGGLRFSPGSVDLDYSPWDPRAPGNGPQSAAGGGSTFHFTFNSPKALNPVEAAREARKVSQQIALLYV